MTSLFRFAGITALFVFLFSFAIAQQRGTISGRVVTDEGAGLPNMSVSLFAQGSGGITSTRRTATTDEEGNFQFTGLPPQSFRLFVIGAKGYVPAPNPSAEREQRLYRLGDNVTLTMTRGGVITGRVTNANGEPIIGVYVNAIRVRDHEGNKLSVQSGYQPRATDDRGVYRIYGLPPGTYVVAANSTVYASTMMSMNSPYQGDAPSYYPSAPRDTAAEVVVVAGGEASGIDIRYRGEPGHAIGGKILGGNDPGTPYYGASVSLTHKATGAFFANAYVQQSSGDSSFAFMGIPDGEYELTAARSDAAEITFRSEARTVAIRGADVSGADLRLMPLASLSGRVVLEAAPNACDPKLKRTLEEVMVLSRRDEKASNDPASATRPGVPTIAANEKGEFTLNGILPGRYRLESNLPTENWFIKSINSSAAAPARQPSTASTNNDIARNGIALKFGEKVTGLTMTISDGAAGLRGKVVAQANAKLPARLRVHLLPVDAASAEDVVRYAETLARSDGAFRFTNLAPGKYWLLVRAIPETEAVDRPAPPVAWDAAGRARLRKEAEAAKNEVELKACQRVTDRALQF